MSPSNVVIRPIDVERDAAKIAAMWNGSDSQWPATWTRGVPFTAELIRQWEEEDRNLIVYVAEVDGEIAGYCSFSEGHRGRENEGYLHLLNVHPKYQKQSIGRRLIQATIDYSVQKGFQRQTLGTWPANFKAVPTYKKTGHFWTPDSSVWMQNFVAGALQMPLARPFFERHDWYRSYVRELAQAEDDQRWEGLKVFTERWEADGEGLTIWIDREARAPVAVETDAVQVAAIADEIEPLGGQSVRLRWRIANKSAAAMQVYVHATGDKGLSIDHREAFSVPAGETVERSAPVAVAEDAPRRKDDGTAPTVRSLIRLNDDEVELFSGLRPKKPLGVGLAPEQMTLAPGVARAVQIELHNAQREPARLTLVLTPGPGLDADWSRQTVEVAAEGHAALPLALTATEEGIYSLAVRVTDEDGRCKPVEENHAIF
ncbi:MAG: GNAT family N-acetyltransferase [Chloroflexota bacterium]